MSQSWHMYQTCWFGPLIHHALKIKRLYLRGSEGNENNIDTGYVPDLQIIWEILSVTSCWLAYRGEIRVVSKPPASAPSQTFSYVFKSQWGSHKTSHRVFPYDTRSYLSASQHTRRGQRRRVPWSASSKHETVVPFRTHWKEEFEE